MRGKLNIYLNGIYLLQKSQHCNGCNSDTLINTNKTCNFPCKFINNKDEITKQN